jgi:hypothetical protein
VRTAATYLGHLFAAIIGTAVLQVAISPIIPRPTTLNSILLRDLLVTSVIALCLGAVASYMRPTKTAYCVWILPALVFFVYLVSYFFGSGRSVLGSPAHNLRAYLGLQWEEGNLRAGTHAYILVLAPLARTISYSIGAIAIACMRHARTGATPEA